jgi:hypothetical protein
LAAQEQVPPEQDEPGSQAWPQPPQLALSVSVSTQAPAQTVEALPGQVAEQAPPTQNGALVGHALPQAPQLFGSAFPLVQA